MSKRKKTSAASPPHEDAGSESVTTRAVVPPEVMERAMGGLVGDESEATQEEHAADSGDAARGSSRDVTAVDDAEIADDEAMPESAGVPVMHAEPDEFDAEMTVNLVGELPLPGRDDLDAPTVTASGDALAEVDSILLQRRHLRGLLEALVFASDAPITPKELAKLASAPQKQVRELLGELQADYSTRGMHLDEVAGGWVFRTSAQYAPFVRDLTKQKPVRLTRAQVETLAIIAYRQPITRPEVDDVRGVDSGPVLKLLLERDLVRILGKRDEPGRPIIYGTTGHFLEFFGLKSLKDLPTLARVHRAQRRVARGRLRGRARRDARGRRAAMPPRPKRARKQAATRAWAPPRLRTTTATSSTPTPTARRRACAYRSAKSRSRRTTSRCDGEDEPGDEDDDEKHASDDDGPTLTSEAPHDDEDA